MASLNIDTILGEVTICQRKELEEMTQSNGLSDAYTATITTQGPGGVYFSTWIKGPDVGVVFGTGRGALSSLWGRD